jgi:dTDP-glucose 4,6-dehydratase
VSVQNVGKFIPRQISNVIDGIRPKLYGKGEMSVTGSMPTTTPRPSLPSSKRASSETYLFSADGEKNNKWVVELILEHMGQPHDAYDHVVDRLGHDLRYAIDSTKLRDELGWEAKLSNFHAGIEDTIAWYRDNEDWWRPQKPETEAKYKEQSQ